MAYSNYPDYVIAYLNPDGTWTESGLKAHWDSEVFAYHLKGGFYIPSYFLI